MADPKTLARFTIVPKGEDFHLHIEDDSGETLELIASEEQLDLLADALDEALEAAPDEGDDEADEELTERDDT